MSELGRSLTVWGEIWNVFFFSEGVVFGTGVSDAQGHLHTLTSASGLGGRVRNTALMMITLKSGAQREKKG